MITQTIGDLYDRCTENFGAHPALTYKGRHCSYARMGENARRIANALQSLGLAKSDKVAFLMANCPEYVFCEYAVAKIGAIRIPLAVLLSPADHIYMMNQVKARS